MSVRLATWNLGWVSPRSPKAAGVATGLYGAEAGLVLLTEARVGLVERHCSHARDVGPNSGSGQPRGCRIVIASHRLLTVVDDLAARIFRPTTPSPPTT